MAVEGEPDTVEQEQPVRQTGQGVVKRLMGELFLLRLPLGDIPADDEDAFDDPIGVEGRCGCGTSAARPG
jgi:hypothetical protein